MPETLAKSQRENQVSFKKVYKVINNILLHKQFLWLSVLIAVSWSSVIAFYAVGPFLYQNIFTITPYYYGVIALMMGGAYLISSFFNRILLKKISPIFLIKTSIVSSTFISVIFVIITYLGYMNLIISTLFCFLIIMNIGFLFINGMTLSLSLFHETAAIATALQCTIWVIIWAVASWIISFFHYSQFTLAFSFTVFAVINLIILIAIHKELIIPKKMQETKGECSR